MKIAIDMQPCQTDSRHRGIGRYVLELVRAMVQSGPNIDACLMLDGCSVDRLRETRRQLRSLQIDATTLSVHYPPLDACAATSGPDVVRRGVGFLRSQQLRALEPDAVLVTSFFEGFHGGHGMESDLDFEALDGIPAAVVAYDLIPLMFPERYLPEGSAYTAWYRSKLEKFRRFDLFFAISEATRDDLVNLLDIDPDRIIVIGAGYRAWRGTPAPAGKRTKPEVSLASRGIHSPFVLTVGNGDWRKNNLAAVECFFNLPRRVRETHQLVLTQIGQDVLDALSGPMADVADRVVILGSVDDETLSRLYEECSVFFFPSRYEGFGLPVLEAMAHGAPVLSSWAGALSEVMFDREALFDPEDSGSASELLAHVLTDADFRKRLSNQGPAHAARFTWEDTARRALEGLAQVVAGMRQSGAATMPSDCALAPEVPPSEKAHPAGAWLPSDDDIEMLGDVLNIQGRSAHAPMERALASVLRGRRRRILIDVSCVVVTNTWTGIQRVVRNYCIGLAALAVRTPGFEVHLVNCDQAGPKYADQFGVERLGLDLAPLSGPVEVEPDDILFLLDSTWEWPERFDALANTVWDHGGEVVRMVYDLVPVLFPETCHPGMPPVFRHWIEHAAARSDGIICISEAVRQDLEDLLEDMQGRGALPFRPWTRAVHLGSDLESGRIGSPSKKVSDLLEDAAGHHVLLAVGTVEPRKSYATILEAFELLWETGAEPRLVIIGREGWNVAALASRLRGHAYAGKLLYWLEDATDGDLDAVMARADALIQASISEGFGLPVVEAGSKGRALLLSNIPAFREIAGDEAAYFPVGDSRALAGLIQRGLEKGGWQSPGNIRTLTWKESSIELLHVLFATDPLKEPKIGIGE